MKLFPFAFQDIYRKLCIKLKLLINSVWGRKIHYMEYYVYDL